MRVLLLLTAIAVGNCWASAHATEASAGGGESREAATPVVTTVGKVSPPAGQAPADPQVEAAQPGTAGGDKPKPPAPPSLIAQINLSTQRMEIRVHGAAVHSWPISSGRAGFETPRGSFRPQWMAKMWYSRKYDMAPMPNAVFINGGVAIHATSSVGLLGQPASHGCIRLSPGNAATFYGLVQKHGMAQTRVHVFGSPPAARLARAPARRTIDASPLRVTGGPPIQGPGSRQGMVLLPPGSPYSGSQSFVHNGVRYVRVR